MCAAACAAATANRNAHRAEDQQNYDQAVAEYTKAVKLKPEDGDARAGLERAKLRASNDHFQRGRRLAATGKYDQALIEYQLASELNPTAAEVDEALRQTRNQLRAKVAVSHEGRTDLEALIDRSRDLPPQGFELPRDARMPASLVFRDANSRDMFLSIAKIGNISIAFDPTFRETSVSIDLRNATLESALTQATEATRTFFHVTAPNSIIVVPDTPAKQREYEDEVVQVLYVSNADLKETMDLLRIVIDARRISPVTGTNAIALKDTRERIAAASRMVQAIDKARPEVIIDVELLEVDRTKLQEYGLQIASPGSPGINGSVNVKTDTSGTITLNALRNLTASDVLLSGVPGLYYRLLKSDTNTRVLANPQLRTMEGTAATAHFGERVPVPRSVFLPLATGGPPQQPITSYDYENIGVNIDITPRTHHDDDVTLQLKVNVQSVSGTGFGDLPKFASREITTTIRLKDGETNMLAGLIRDDERKTIEGIPGLSDIPLVGSLFSHTHNERTQTDIILTLTPHIIRILDVNEADLRAFRVGRESLPAISDLPLPIDIPRPADTPPPAQPPAGAPPIVLPPSAPTPAPATPAPPAQPSPSIPPPSPRLPG